MGDGTQTPSQNNFPARAHRDDMLADWQSGMRQVDIAAKYGCSQALVSRLIGGSPRRRIDPPDAPSYSDLRARNLLAQSLISHRLDTSNPDVAAVLAVLRGDLSLAGVA